MVCQYCNESFESLESLERHCLSVHGKLGTEYETTIDQAAKKATKDKILVNDSFEVMMSQVDDMELGEKDDSFDIMMSQVDLSEKNDSFDEMMSQTDENEYINHNQPTGSEKVNSWLTKGKVTPSTALPRGNMSEPVKVTSQKPKFKFRHIDRGENVSSRYVAESAISSNQNQPMQQLQRSLTTNPILGNNAMGAASVNFNPNLPFASANPNL